MTTCINSGLSVSRLTSIVLPKILQTLDLSDIENLSSIFTFIPGTYIPTLESDDIGLPGVFIPEDINVRPFIPIVGLPVVDFVEKIPNRPGIPGVVLVPNDKNPPIFVPELPIDNTIEGVFVPGIPGAYIKLPGLDSVDLDLDLDLDLPTYLISDFIPSIELNRIDPYELLLPGYNKDYIRNPIFIPNASVVLPPDLANNTSVIPGILIPGSNESYEPVFVGVDNRRNQDDQDRQSNRNRRNNQGNQGDQYNRDNQDRLNNEDNQDDRDSQDDIRVSGLVPGLLTISFPINLGDPATGIFIPSNPLIPPFIPGFPYIPQDFLPTLNSGNNKLNVQPIPILVPNRDLIDSSINPGDVKLSTPTLPVPSVDISPNSLGVVENTSSTEISFDEFTRFEIIPIRTAHENLREVNRSITIIISKLKTFTHYLDKYVETQGLNFVNQANVTRYEIIESSVTNSIKTAEILVNRFKSDNNFYKSYWEIPFKYDGVYRRTQERTKEIYQNSYSTANIIMSHVTQGNKVDFRAGRVINQATHFINLAKAEIQNYAPITTTISEVMETQSVSNRLTSDEIEFNSMVNIIRTSEQQHLISNRFSHISKLTDWRTENYNEHIKKNKTTLIGGSESKEIKGSVSYSADGTVVITSNTKLILNAPEIVLNGTTREGSYQLVEINNPEVPTVKEESLKPYYERISSHPSNLASSGYGDIPRDTDEIPPPTVGTEGTIMSHLVTPGIAARQYKRVK